MRKYHSVLHEKPTAARRSRTHIWIGLAVLLMFSPLIYEYGMLSYARWQTVLGSPMTVKTPILDTISKLAASARRGAEHRTMMTFLRGNWKSAYAIPFALGWALVASLVLRRTR